jgi:hypothetical protein
MADIDDLSEPAEQANRETSDWIEENARRRRWMADDLRNTLARISPPSSGLSDTVIADIFVSYFGEGRAKEIANKITSPDLNRERAWARKPWAPAFNDSTG